MSALTQEERKDILKAVKPAFDTDESKSLVKFAEKVSEMGNNRIEYSGSGPIAVESHTAIITEAANNTFTLASPTRDGIGIKIILAVSENQTINTVQGSSFIGPYGVGSPMTVYGPGVSVNLYSLGNDWYYGYDANIDQIL